MFTVSQRRWQHTYRQSKLFANKEERLFREKLYLTTGKLVQIDVDYNIYLIKLVVPSYGFACKCGYFKKSY